MNIALRELAPQRIALGQCRNASAEPSILDIEKENAMLYWAAVFFVLAIIAGVFGFGGIAAGAVEIAKILFVIFIVIFLVSLVMGALRRGP